MFVEEDRVIEFIAKFCCENKNAINPDTEIGKDLKVDGDDAADLLAAFSSEFNVDSSKFDFERYFGPELGFNPIVFLINLIRGDDLEKLFVRDFIQAAKLGRWGVSNFGNLGA